MESQLGNYQILGQLGAGGMGVVYRAKDLRLDREVAVKVLPAEVAHDADRLRRFELEARATGSLNHPNILTIYDIGSQNGTAYLVAELLEGEELRAQLKAGALPIKRAMDYAQQIAAGLTAAHTKGIVHRDLKPENLFVTSDGRVKILDFGLAKLTEKGRRREGEKGRLGEDDATLALPPPLPHSPSPLLTAPGTVMGTVAYMSPEQVRGEVVDVRSDIFSFGQILYEMLAGKRAFDGPSIPDLMSAILKDEPPELNTTNSQVPPPLEKIVQRCLEKKPERRFQSASDLGFALSTLPTTSSTNRTEAVQAQDTAITTKHSGWRERIAWLIAGAAVLTAIALGVAYVRRPATPTAVTMRLSVNPPEGAAMFEQPTISPDGRTLAFVASTAGKRQIWGRPLDSPMARPMAGTEDVEQMFWSPDSQFIGFFAGGKIKKVALSGGAPVILCNTAAVVSWGTWNPAGVILFSEGPAGIKRVDANGSPTMSVTTVDFARGEAIHQRPVFLPDGRHFLFYVQHNDPVKSGIYVRALDGGEARQLLTTESRTVWAGVNPAVPGEGWLVFMRQGALLAQPFDFSRHRFNGDPLRIVEQVQTTPNGAHGRFSLSDNGVLVYIAGRANQQLTLTDRAGQKSQPVGVPGLFSGFSFSPDEQRIAMGQLDPQNQSPDIHLLDLARGRDMRFTLDPAQDSEPYWSPDGSRIVWTSRRGGLHDLYWKAANGAGEDTLLWKSAYSKFPSDWSKDGRFILYTESTAQTGFDIWILSLTEEHQARPWLKTEFGELSAKFSPDGKWIAYATNAPGRYEIYVRAFNPDQPEAGGYWQVSTNGGRRPQWRRDGKELYYISADEKLMAVAVTLGAEVKAAIPRALFDLRSLRAVINADVGYAVTGDGQKFLFVTSAEETALTPFTVVTNWMAEMKR